MATQKPFQNAEYPYDMENIFAFKTDEDTEAGKCGKWVRQNNETERPFYCLKVNQLILTPTLAQLDIAGGWSLINP